MRCFWLDVHRPYACRHSGACCSSRWPIPIERPRAALVDTAIAAGLVAPAASPWLVEHDAAPGDIAGTLALQADGHCVWHQRSASPSAPPGPDLCTTSPPRPERGCAIHSSRPMSCVHFPYVCVIDARGVYVTLSHYCPTAAALLFSHDGPATVVEGPPPIAGLETPEGLDARESLPPAVGGRLLGWDEVTAWERDEIARVQHQPSGPLDDGDLVRFEAARAAVPAPLSWPGAPSGAHATWNDKVERGWQQHRAVVGRYLASKVHASWAMYLGDGLASVTRGVAQAESVLKVEAARAAAASGRPLDTAALAAAIRQADLLLLHYMERG